MILLLYICPYGMIILIMCVCVSFISGNTLELIKYTNYPVTKKIDNRPYRLDTQKEKEYVIKITISIFAFFVFFFTHFFLDNA